MRNKRGQVTIYIILGILILVAIGVIIFISNTSLRAGLSSENDEAFLASQVEPLISFIDGCVENIAKEDLASFKKYSGYQQENVYSLDYKGAKINYLVYKDGGPANQLNPISEIESGLADSVKNKFRSQCNLKNFKANLKLNDDFSKFNVKVTVRDAVIDLEVSYPLILSKGNSQLKIDAFNVDVATEFGVIYKAVTDIINGEINLRFDKLKYEQANQNIFITKDNLDLRNSVYTVTTKKGEEFLIFAVRR